MNWFKKIAYGIKMFWHALKSVWDNLGTSTVQDWNDVGWVGRITAFIAAAIVVVASPLWAIAMSFGVITVESKSSLITLIVYVLIGHVFFLIACMGSELLFPFVYLSFLSLFATVNREYAKAEASANSAV